MLIVIQIITILQGLFLGAVLFHRRDAYKHPVFELFIGYLISVVLFSIGDDDYNLFVDNSEWFFFHEPLVITFFFLFIRYSHRDKEQFSKPDLLFFLPYVLYVVFEGLSNHFTGNAILHTVGKIIELSFLGMLFFSIYEIVLHHKSKWLIAFILPFTVIFGLDAISSFFSFSDESIFSLDSYGIFLIALSLFYFVTFKLITSPKDFLPTSDTKYKASKLSTSKAESVTQELDRLMTEEKLFKNQKLSADEVADRLGISRQRLSEILSTHIGMRFQDLLNQYRVEEFIACLHQEAYKNYTIFGIATEAGFSSKSSFNATFKKLKGLTPSQYKKENLT